LGIEPGKITETSGEDHNRLSITFDNPLHHQLFGWRSQLDMNIFFTSRAPHQARGYQASPYVSYSIHARRLKLDVKIAYSRVVLRNKSFKNKRGQYAEDLAPAVHQSPPMGRQ